MKIPKVLKQPAVEIESGSTRTLLIDNLDTPSWPSRDIGDPKEYVKFIRNTEKMIRQSVEYRRYVNFLKTELDLTSCTFLSNININEMKRVSLEFHHYPFSLFDIVSTVLTYNQHFHGPGWSPCIFDLAEEVVEIHYSNKIGLVPLAETVHELAHSGAIFIPLNLVFGDVSSFIKKYKLGMSDELKNQLSSLIDMTERFGEDYDSDTLDRIVTYLEIPERGKIKEVLIEQKMIA
jgi:hypothetical protein